MNKKIEYCVRVIEVVTCLFIIKTQLDTGERKFNEDINNTL